MRVNVFVLKAGNDCRPTLLLLPDDKPEISIPKHLRHWEWEYYITTVSGDEVIGVRLGSSTSFFTATVMRWCRRPLSG